MSKKRVVNVFSNFLNCSLIHQSSLQFKKREIAIKSIFARDLILQTLKWVLRIMSSSDMDRTLFIIKGEGHQSQSLTDSLVKVNFPITRSLRKIQGEDVMWRVAEMKWSTAVHESYRAVTTQLQSGFVCPGNSILINGHWELDRR